MSAKVPIRKATTAAIKTGDYTQEELMAEVKFVMSKIDAMVSQDYLPPRSMVWRLSVLSDRLWNGL